MGQIVFWRRLLLEAFLKDLLKKTLFLVGVALALPFIFLAKIEEWIWGASVERVFSGCKECLACIPTIIGEIMRKGFYCGTCEDISSDSCFMFGSMIAHRETSVGKGSVVGAGSILGKTKIGANVLIAARVSVLSGRYQHGRPKDRCKDSIHGPEGEFKSISIGSNSWIGEGAIVMADIAENCTIAANAVVFNPTIANGTYIGNPARKVNLK